MKKQSNPKPKLMLIGDLFESFSEFEEMGFLSRMQDLYSIYGENFDTVYIKTYESDRFENLPENVEHLPFINIPKTFRKYFYFFLAGFLNYRRVDYVEIDGTSAILPALLYKIFGAKLFLYHKWDTAEHFRVHGKPFLRFMANVIQVLAFKTADVIAVTTKEMRKEAEKHTRNDKVHLVPNYVDVERFKPVKMEKRRNLLIFIGRLHPDKNLEMLLEVMKGLPQFKLWIVGDGILRGDLIDFKNRNEINNVKFLGVIPNEELPNYLNKAEAFILISHREGHPKALIEAMACGLPCIGTNVEGIRDVIIGGENGFLCDRNEESIRNYILTLFGDRERMRRLGENARRFAVNDYSMDELVKRRIRLIKGDLEGSDSLCPNIDSPLPNRRGPCQ